MSNQTINYSLNKRENNFDVIRFIAAVLVIYSHAFPLSLGHEETEPLLMITDGQATFGGLAVRIFFVLSGFLITMSMINSKSITYYVKSRVLRIFPALIPVLLITAFVIGPLFTSLSWTEYFQNISTYNYLINITLFSGENALPGLFESNPYHTKVNGSLWTLPLEFFFYFVVGVLGYLKLLNKWNALALFIITIALNVLEFPIGKHYVYNFMYFNAGMLLYLFRNEIKLKYSYALIAFLLIIFSVPLGLFNYCFSIFGSYLIIFLSLGVKTKLSNFSKYGDFSYGLYIVAFPTQQIITQIFNNNITPTQNFIIAFPASLFLAYFSWHLVEKQAINLKNRKVFPVKLRKQRVA